MDTAVEKMSLARSVSSLYRFYLRMAMRLLYATSELLSQAQQNRLNFNLIFILILARVLIVAGFRDLDIKYFQGISQLHRLGWTQTCTVQY